VEEERTDNANDDAVAAWVREEEGFPENNVNTG
jgi:hypothetical protein